MNPIQTLSLALGAGFSSGLNLYATVATLGLLERFGIVHLPASLDGLAHPWVMGIAAGLYPFEFYQVESTLVGAPENTKVLAPWERSELTLVRGFMPKLGNNLGTNTAEYRKNMLVDAV